MTGILPQNVLKAAVKPLKGYRVIHLCGHDKDYVGITKRNAEILAHQECGVCLQEREDHA